MIEFTTGTEITTAATDLLNAAIALILLLRCFKLPDDNKKRRNSWRLLFISAMLSSLMGAFVHGIVISRAVYYQMWVPLIIIMYITAASLLCCIFSEQNFPDQQVLAIVLAVMFYILLMVIFSCLSDPNYWRLKLFFVYAGATLLACTVRCIQLIKRGRSGLLLILLAMALQIIGGVCQMLQFTSFTLIWQFDHNSIAHFCISFSLLAFYIGYRRLQSDELHKQTAVQSKESSYWQERARSKGLIELPLLIQLPEIHPQDANCFYIYHSVYHSFHDYLEDYYEKSCV